MRRNPARVTLALLSGLAVIALAACGDDGGVNADDASSDTEQTDVATTTTPSVSTTAAPETTAPATTAATTTTPLPTGAPTTTPAPETTAPDESDIACGDLAPMIGSAAVTSTVAVDWDGNGTQDATAIVYETEAGNGDFRIRVEQGEGTGTEMAIISDGIAQPQVLGPVQVDFSLGSEDPQPEELMVLVGANASGYNVGVFFNEGTGCIGRFKGADELELVLPIHASVGTASGVACEGTAGSQFLVRTTAEASAGSGEYDVHDIKLRRDGDQLLDDVDIPGFIVDDGSPDSPFLRYASITGCGIDVGGE